MKITHALVASLFTLLGTSAAYAGGAPSITSTDTTIEVADAPSDAQIHPLEVYGTNLALPTTTGATWGSDVQIWAADPTHGWTLATATDPWVRHNGWSPSSFGLTFIGLAQPGTLGIYVCVRDMGCAYHATTIRARSTRAPILYQPDNTVVASLDSSVSPDDPRRLIYFQATELNDAATTCFYIENVGYVHAFGNIDAGDGWGTLWLPNLPVGNLRIWVSNSGCYGGAHWSVNRWIQSRLDLGSGGFGGFGR